MSIEEVMALPSTDDQSFSLKVYAAAYVLKAAELASAIGACDMHHEEQFEAMLVVCEEEIAKGHALSFQSQ